MVLYDAGDIVAMIVMTTTAMAITIIANGSGGFVVVASINGDGTKAMVATTLIKYCINELHFLYLDK